MDHRIGIVGLGQMGSAMARRLMREGIRPMVFNRSTGVTAELAALGARAAPSLTALGTACELIFTVLPDGPDVEGVVTGAGGLLERARPGTLFVECSTIDPLVTGRVGAAVRSAGCRMIDAAIGGRPPQAEQGKLVFMVGAQAEDLAAARPVLQLLGSDIVHCGGPGMGITMKVVNNLMSQSLQLMDLEGLALGVKAGLDPRVMLKVLTSTAADNAPLRTRIPDNVLTGRYAPGFAARLAHKDQGLAHAMAARLGVPLFALGQARHLYSVALGQGLGEGPSEVLGKVIEQLAGVSLRFKDEP